MAKTTSRMKTVTGDIISLAHEGKFDILVHGCNCYGIMETGLSRFVKDEFPAAYAADQNTAMGAKSKLGNISYAMCELPVKNIIVVNAYIQFTDSGKGSGTDYTAVHDAFEKIKARFTGFTIAYARLGTGDGGGNWLTIRDIISETLEGENHFCVAYPK